MIWTEEDHKIKGQLYRLISLMGGKSDILSIIGSWKDSMSDSDTLTMLKAYIQSKENEQAEKRE